MYKGVENQALSKCLIWFYDGNRRTFYSLDKKHKRAKPNQALGFHRFEKMLFETFKGKWETAIIYENRRDGAPLVRYKRGVKVWAA